MKTRTSPPARKRTARHTLNDQMPNAQHLTDNLSAIVERERSQQAHASIARWNAFEDQYGAFADEYSTL